MKISIYLDRINLLHKLLSQEKTGTPKQLAKKIRISESRLYVILQDLKLDRVPIKYDRKRKTYYYYEPFKMHASFVLENITS
jgi:predicted DNA-binding transcriptional regulator YafY